MSTSQLTYAVWVNHWYKESTNTIYLQTAEQEKFFRESVYGGRTYKYKNSFISTQRDAFLKQDLVFEDIDDYLVDLDVNSLYPAAMMKEFPIGTPARLDDTTISEFNQYISENGKLPSVGIFRIDYKPTKIIASFLDVKMEN